MINQLCARFFTKLIEKLIELTDPIKIKPLNCEGTKKIDQAIILADQYFIADYLICLFIKAQSISYLITRSTITLVIISWPFNCFAIRIPFYFSCGYYEFRTIKQQYTNTELGVNTECQLPFHRWHFTGSQLHCKRPSRVCFYYKL